MSAVSALDVSIRAQIMNLFKDLQREYEVSYLLVAHDLGTTRYMADDIAVMYLGQIVEFAPSEDLFEHLRHPYTQALLSATLSSHPDEAKEEIVLSGEIPSPLNPPTGCRFNPAVRQNWVRYANERRRRFATAVHRATLSPATCTPDI